MLEYTGRAWWALRESPRTALLLALVFTASCGDSSETDSARAPDHPRDAGGEVDASGERDASVDSAEGSPDSEADGFVPPEDAQVDVQPADTASEGDPGTDAGSDAGAADGEPLDGSPDAASRFCGDSIRDP